MFSLRSILESAGVIPVRETDKEIYAPCPQHEKRTGKLDRHPSWSINKKTFVHLCFSCRYSGSLTTLLFDLLGTVPDDLDKAMLKEFFVQRSLETREHPEEHVEPVLSDRPPLTEWSLRNILRDVPQRLLNLRRLMRPAVDHYEVRWDGDAKQWVMPLRSATTGDLLGAQYRQKGLVLTLPEGVPKATTLFGFKQCCEFNYCAIVESPLDAVRLVGIGVPAVSSLGAFVSHEQVRLLATNFTRVYLALDNDKAGNSACEVLGPMLRKAGTAPMRWNYTGLVDDEGEPAKDPGDVDTDEALADSWSRTLRMGL